MGTVSDGEPFDYRLRGRSEPGKVDGKSDGKCDGKVDGKCDGKCDRKVDGMAE